ncbi:MAG TPA: universal stress protein [Candidatus Bathyarchaeota archaeon]|nr:universal stress protein [Candidatus Bathyarchaeota archaeon]
MIKKILVPIDGSKHSDRALDYALDLAEKYSADIQLVSVAQPVVATGPMFLTQPILPPASTAMYVKEIEAAHKKMLSEALKKAKESKPDIKISKKLVTGRPADKIVEIADKGNFDLIVMGSRGTGGIKEFFLGSVSDRVADEAPCPVVIVKYRTVKRRNDGHSIT